MGKGRPGLGVGAYRDRWTESNVLHNTHPQCAVTYILATGHLRALTHQPDPEDLVQIKTFCCVAPSVKSCTWPHRKSWRPADHQHAHMFCTCLRRHVLVCSLYLGEITERDAKPQNLLRTLAYPLFKRCKCTLCCADIYTVLFLACGKR